jgi:hypothetical protein
MIKVAQTVLDEGFLKLKTAFAMVSPNVTYTALHACTKKVAPNPASKSRDWGSKKDNYSIYLVEKQSSIKFCDPF